MVDIPRSEGISCEHIERFERLIRLVLEGPERGLGHILRAVAVVVKLPYVRCQHPVTGLDELRHQDLTEASSRTRNQNPRFSRGVDRRL